MASYLKNKFEDFTSKVSVLNSFRQKAIEYDMDTEEDYCADIRAMYGAHSPWQVPEFTLVAPGNDHVVLYDSWKRVPNVKPTPVVGKQEMWDQYFVKMPYSEMSSIGTKKRWHVIKTALAKGSIHNSKDLAAAILEYNDSYKNEWNFLALHKFFDEYLGQTESEEFFKTTLPQMIRLALLLDKHVPAPIPLLRQQMNASISMSQLQVASLLANAFFCTFPRRNSTGPGSEYANYPRINFTQLYERVDLENGMEKLRCLIHYFKRVTTKMPTGVVTFTRRALDKYKFPRWDGSDIPVASVPVYVDDEICIEEAEGLIQVDFANKYLGGGVLGRGCVQEEIRFLICPELIASMLFTEKLEDNEAVVIIGCERYSNYTGYGRNFKFASNFEDDTPCDSSGRRRCVVLAIDAIPYHYSVQQFQKGAVLRELNKAWVGFSYDSDPNSPKLRYPGVATGNWGCGAFRGSPQLKSLLQLMACAQARRPMAYLSFGDTTVKNEVVVVYNLLKQHRVTVGQLFSLIGKYCKRKPFTTDPSMDLHTYLIHQLDKPPGGPVSRSPSPQRKYRQSNPLPDNKSSTSDYEIYTDDEDVDMDDQSSRRRSPDLIDLEERRLPAAGRGATRTSNDDWSGANRNTTQGPSDSISRLYISRGRGLNPTATKSSMIGTTGQLTTPLSYTGKSGSNVSSSILKNKSTNDCEQGTDAMEYHSQQACSGEQFCENWSQRNSGNAASSTNAAYTSTNNYHDLYDTKASSYIKSNVYQSGDNADSSGTNRVVEQARRGQDFKVTIDAAETNMPSQSGVTGGGRSRDPSRGRSESWHEPVTKPPQNTSPITNPGWWKSPPVCEHSTRRPPALTETKFPTLSSPGSRQLTSHVQSIVDSLCLMYPAVAAFAFMFAAIFRYSGLLRLITIFLSTAPRESNESTQSPPSTSNRHNNPGDAYSDQPSIFKTPSSSRGGKRRRKKRDNRPPVFSFPDIPDPADDHLTPEVYDIQNEDEYTKGREEIIDLDPQKQVKTKNGKRSTANELLKNLPGNTNPKMKEDQTLEDHQRNYSNEEETLKIEDEIKDHANLKQEVQNVIVNEDGQNLQRREDCHNVKQDEQHHKINKHGNTSKKTNIEVIFTKDVVSFIRK